MSQPKRFHIGCVLAVIGAIAAGLLLLGLIGLTLLGSLAGPGPGPKIAQIDLEGIIVSAPEAGFLGSSDSMVRRLEKSLKRAREDESVKAVVLRINSPGGEVTAADTIHHYVKQTVAVKPVVVYMDSVAASGGYYVACAGTEMFANRTTMTGSIGVIISTLSYHELFGKFGLQFLTFTSGKFKDTLSGGRPMRDDERELVQNLVNQTYERFLQVVMEGRPKVPEEKLRTALADGRILSGKDALDNGLIDRTGYFEDAVERAKELSNAPDAKLIRYSEEVSIFQALGLVESRLRPAPVAVELRLPDSLQTSLKPGMLYLLPPFFAP